MDQLAEQYPFYVAERDASDEARPSLPFSRRSLVHDCQNAVAGYGTTLHWAVLFSLVTTAILQQMVARMSLVLRVGTRRGDSQQLGAFTGSGDELRPDGGGSRQDPLLSKVRRLGAVGRPFPGCVDAKPSERREFRSRP